RLIIEMTDSRSEIVHIPYDEAYAKGFEDMRRRVPDISKLSRLIGRRPRAEIREILRDVIEFMRGRPQSQELSDADQRFDIADVDGRSGWQLLRSRSTRNAALRVEPI